MSPGKKSTKKKGVNGGSKPDSGPKLLADGNPQIPKGYGDGPVQDYIAAMPRWNAKSASTSTRSSCGWSPR